MTKINIEDVKVNGGAYLVEDTMVWSAGWDEKYYKKNIKFFDLLIKAEYDELILAVDMENTHIYYELVVIRKDDKDLVVPLPLVMETLHFGGGYEDWDEFISDSAIVWLNEDIDEGVDHRTFSKVMTRKNYYLDREYKDNKKKIDVIAELLEEECIELPKSYNTEGELFNIITFHFDNDDNWDGEITISTKMDEGYGDKIYTHHLTFEELVEIIEEAY
jgi:hypothetical protein